MKKIFQYFERLIIIIFYCLTYCSEKYKYRKLENFSI